MSWHFIFFVMAAEGMPVYLPREIIVSVSFALFMPSSSSTDRDRAWLPLRGHLWETGPGPWYRIPFNGAQLALPPAWRGWSSRDWVVNRAT